MGGGEDNFVNKQLIDMKRISKLLLTLCLLVVVGEVWGQAPQLTTEEIASLKKLAEDNTHRNTILNIWAFLGPIFGGLATWLGLRKKTEDWAEKEITKKASEKFGVDWTIVKMLVDERRILLRDRGAVKIAIINQKTGEKGDLSKLISGYGFPTPEFFTVQDTSDGSKKHFGTAFKKGDFNLLIFDNEDGEMQEENIVKMIQENQTAFKSNILWYTKDQVNAYGAMTKSGVGFVKQSSRFVIELDDRLTNS
jgi:hypothetical protein